MVQIMMVSIKVPVMEISPCSAGHFVFAAAATIGALPRPDSLENKPRAIPLRIANIIVAPKKPPVAAVPVKASCRTIAIAPGSASRNINRMAMVVITYSAAINGTILSATTAMLFNPPRVITATNTVSAIDV